MIKNKYVYVVTIEGMNSVRIYGIYSNLKIAEIKAKEVIANEKDNYHDIKIKKVLIDVDFPLNIIETIIIQKGTFGLC